MSRSGSSGTGAELYAGGARLVRDVCGVVELVLACAGKRGVAARERGGLVDARGSRGLVQKSPHGVAC